MAGLATPFYNFELKVPFLDEPRVVGIGLNARFCGGRIVDRIVYVRIGETKLVTDTPHTAYLLGSCPSLDGLSIS